MDTASVVYVLLGQLSLLAGIAVCVWLRPHYVLDSNEGGVSNYATDRRTVVPYSSALLLEAVFTLLAASQVPYSLPAHGGLTRMLAGFAGLVLLVLASSYAYKRGEVLRQLHFLGGILLFVYEALFGVWLLADVHHNLLAYGGLALLLAGGLVCLLSLKNIVQRLFLGQAIASFGFCLLLLSVLATI